LNVILGNCTFKYQCNPKLKVMTIRTLFTVILKVLGIFFIKNFLETIPQLLSLLNFLNDFGGEQKLLIGLSEISLMLLILGLVSYFLIFKTDLIIDKLQLDKGFGEEFIQLNIHRTTILSIAIIIMGGLLIINELGNFCRQLFLYYQEVKLVKQNYLSKNPNISYSIISFIKIILGILLIIYQKQIVHFIEWRRKK